MKLLGTPIGSREFTTTLPELNDAQAVSRLIVLQQKQPPAPDLLQDALGRFNECFQNMVAEILRNLVRQKINANKLLCL